MLDQKNKLVRLFCPNAKIKDLDGIEIFTSLKHLDLSGNYLLRVDKLIHLNSLSHLNLRDNRLKTIQSLNKLKNLKYLDISKNREIDCEELIKIEQKASIKLIYPNHCIN